MGVARALVYWALVAGTWFASGSELAFAQDLFETKVRPVLATECFACHTESALGGLRLDSRDGLLKGGESGPAIVPGDPDRSLLITAVRQTGALKMPMGRKLTAEQVAALVDWVRSGAVWPESVKVSAGPTISSERRAFWSFQPLRLSSPAAVPSSSWARTEIDRFILGRLHKEGLKPAPPADRRTLLRRATLDLTGLPPTAAEIAAFEADKSPEAFAKVVDRLLASPQYGERWGRLWLDVARYGEDDYRSLDPMGRGHAPYPFAHLYRDWVTRAFNDDLPYHEFVRAQLAGDLMDERQRVRTLPALGFLGGGPWFYDNGAVEITRADERHDRIDVVTRGFLGLTAGCARCHDHKYDPISTRDYYGLAGVFANTVYKEYPQVPGEVVDEYKVWERRLENREELLGDFNNEESRRLAEGLALQISRYMMAVYRIAGEAKEEFSKVVDAEKLDYELLDRYVKFLARPRRQYPFLKDWQDMIARKGKKDEAQKLATEFQSLVLDIMFEKKELDRENEIILAKSLPGTKKKKRRMKPNEFITNDDFCPSCGVETKTINLERFNLWTEVFVRDLDEPLLPGTDARPKPGLLLFRGWGLERQLSPDRRAYLASLREEIDRIKKSMPAPYPYVHGVGEREGAAIDLPISLRGSPENLGEIVPRGFLEILSPGDRRQFGKGSGRLELAEAIIEQPLAMRVIVNRVWKWHFGTGIVDTPSNFGVTGERPAHPELLDYLAEFFQRNGMSIKRLHKEIMMSAVYQTDSRHTDPVAQDKDPGNRLYWKSNLRRMDAEQLRDSLLSVSGALDLKLYGPPDTLKPDYNRRTLYGKVSRYKLDEYLQLFDFPSPNISAEQRYTTIVPLQRLFFMNSDFVQQQAELVAEKTADAPDTAGRIQQVYREVLGRTATAEEIRLAGEYLATEPMRQYEEQKKRDMERPEDTDTLTAGSDQDPAAEAEEGMMAGVTPRSGKKDETARPLKPVTALGRFVKLLMSSNEFVFIR